MVSFITRLMGSRQACCFITNCPIRVLLTKSHPRRQEMKTKAAAWFTHTLKLDQINEGFELMKRGESIRSAVM
jgi:Zn-dependent alcohol dehydrogenase